MNIHTEPPGHFETHQLILQGELPDVTLTRKYDSSANYVWPIIGGVVGFAAGMIGYLYVNTHPLASLAYCIGIGASLFPAGSIPEAIIEKLNNPEVFL